jgi:hypothetical protein
MSESEELGKKLLIGIGILAAVTAWIGSGNEPTEAINLKTATSDNIIQERNDKELTVQSFKILGAGTGFTIANKAAQSVFFGIKDNIECSATWQLDDLNPQVVNALIKKDKNNRDKTTQVSCTFDGQTYVQSSKHETSFELGIINNDPETKSASLIIKLSLLKASDIANPQYLNINLTQVDISPDTYDQIF